MISRKDILPRYDNQGKTSYQDLISQKDCLPRHDITTRRLAKIMISRKDIFPRYILARRLSEISYLGKTSFRDIYLDKTSFRDIISWQEVLLQYYVLVRRLSLIIISRKDDFPWYHISVKRLSVICYLGKTSFHETTSWKDVILRSGIEERHRSMCALLRKDVVLSLYSIFLR